MAFVVETGAGLATSNSYVTVAAALEVHAGNLYTTEWTAADNTKKETALRMATRVIDTSTRFRGFRNSLDQALEWPRTGARKEDYSEVRVYGLAGGLSGVNYYASTEIPAPLMTATALLALDLLRGDRTVDADSKGIGSLSLGQGAIAITFSKGDTPLPLSDEIQRILMKLGTFRFSTAGNVRVRRVM